MIYFDNAATTFPKPDIVLDYVDWVQRNMAVNVGRGSYKVAKEAMQITDLAKQRMGELVHANSAQNVFFTPSATIAANEISQLSLTEYKQQSLFALHYLDRTYIFL